MTTTATPITPTTEQANREIILDGITHIVINSITREQAQAGHPHTYANMVRCHQVAYHNVRRPRGKKVSIVIEYESGHFRRWYVKCCVNLAAARRKVSTAF